LLLIFITPAGLYKFEADEKFDLFPEYIPYDPYIILFYPIKIN
jgi:hypothetical protein